jgi:hypothetical protein
VFKQVISNAEPILSTMVIVQIHKSHDFRGQVHYALKLHTKHLLRTNQTNKQKKNQQNKNKTKKPTTLFSPSLLKLWLEVN